MPNWAYHGSAYGGGDFSNNGWLSRASERVLQHYRSGLNSIPSTEAFLRDPADLYLLRLAAGSISGVLTNIDEDGAPAMAFHGDPKFMTWDPASGDHGLAFYGHSHNTQSFLVKHPAFGDLCYFCDLEKGAAGNLSVTPRDSYRRTVFIAALGLQVRSDAGTIARVEVEEARVTVHFDAVGTQPLSQFRFRVLCRSPKLCARGEATYKPTGLTMTRGGFVLKPGNPSALTTVTIPLQHHSQQDFNGLRSSPEGTHTRLKSDDVGQQHTALTGWIVDDMTGGALAASIAAGLINRHLKRPAAMINIRDSDMPWLEEMQRQDPSARRTTYRNVSSAELQEVAVSLGAAGHAVLFNESEQHSISTVVTLCGVHKALAVADPQQGPRIPTVFDARGKWANALEASEYAVRELLPSTSRQALVLQAPHVFVGGYLADLAVAGYGPEPTLPLFAVWPESPYSNPTVPSLCNESAPQWSLFGDLVEGKTADAHGWEGPGEVGNKMPTVIGYHDKGPGAWAECLNLCTPKHRTISLVGDIASNLAFHARAQPVVSLAQHPPKPVGPYDKDKTFVAIVNSDGDNMQIDQCRINDRQLSGMAYRAASCALPNAVCPPVAWTMSNRMKEIAPVILRWWFARATPSDSFIFGPSGYGYVYPGLLDRSSQTAFANVTAAAGASLGMTGYTHWDWVSDFSASLPFLEDIARTGLDTAMVATVPDIWKPNIPDVVGGRLAIVKPTSVVSEGVGQWDADDANAPKGCGTCTIPPTPSCPVCVQPNPSAASLAQKLLAIPKGEITYIYKIWSVNFTAVEALGREKDALRRAKHDDDSAKVVALAENGKALSTIVIPADASAGVRQAAEEISQYVSRMAGAPRLAIEALAAPSSDALNKVFVGHVEWALRETKFDADKLPPEGYSVFAHNSSWLFVVGKNDSDACGLATNACSHNDTLHASYGLLDSLGVTWLWPGPSGDVIPSTPRVTAPVAGTISSSPPLIQRHMRPVYNSKWLSMIKDSAHNMAADRALSTWINDTVYATLAAHEARWLQRMRMGQHDVPPWGQAFMTWWDKYNTSHPEYFALQPDGHRGPGAHLTPDRVKMCVSNPELHKAIAEGGTSHNHFGLSAAEDDSNVGYCTCSKCTAWDNPNVTRWDQPGASPTGSLSDRYARFFDSVSAVLAEKSPEAIVTAYAYEQYRDPPTSYRIKNNVMMGYVGFGYPSLPAEKAADKSRWGGWQTAGAKSLFWRPNCLIAGDGMPYMFAGQIAQDFKWLGAHGLAATDFDSLMGHWASAGPTYWATAMMHWAPEATDPHSLLAKWSAGFGPAKLAMLDYVTYWERWTNVTFTSNATRTRIENLTRAISSAAGTEHGWYKK